MKNLGDRDVWRAVNPGMAYGRPALESVEDEYHSMDRVTFARERLGRWDQSSSKAFVFDAARWAERVSARPQGGVLSYGVKFTPDGSGVALAAAYRHKKGVHVEPIRQANLGEGTQWLVDEIVAVKDELAQVVIDGRSGAGYLVEALRRAGLRNQRMILRPTVDQYTTAHQMFEQAFLAGEVTHGDVIAFTEQVLGVTRRKIGDQGGYGWGSEQGETVSVDAVTLAHWGALVTRRRPGVRQRVSV